MTEPALLGCPISTLFLYFLCYAFAGWVLETVYCSIGERRLVSRGFLYGPICPIYGVGVLLMILFFKPLAGNPLVFYLVSTVTMSAWEYFVGWLLEVTTHMKYWDYSKYRFNLKGRICLWVCLVWGLLSYVAIFWLHPPVEALIARIPVPVRQIGAAVLFAVLVTDAALTIRELALMTRVMNKLQQVGDELQVKAALGRMELGDRLDEVRDVMEDRLSDAREALSDAKEAAEQRAAKARERYDELLAAAEQRSRRFRRVYSHFSAPHFDPQLRQDILERIRQANEERKARREK